MNAYAKVYLMPGKLQTQTSSVVKDTRDPTFYEEFVFNTEKRSLKDLSIRVRLYNKRSTFRRDDQIGTVELRLGQLDLSSEMVMWKNLEANCKVCLTWVCLKAPITLLDGNMNLNK